MFRELLFRFRQGSAPKGRESPEVVVPASPQVGPTTGRRGLILLGLLLFLAVAACGYRPLGRGEFPSGGPRPTLAIPLFENRSTEIGLEALFANTFAETFSRSGAVRLAARPDQADLVLEGRISSVAYSSVAYYNISQSLVRRVTIRVDLKLTQRQTGKVLWKDFGMVEEDYVAGETYQQGEVLKEMGIRRGAATLARKMLDRVLLVL